MDLESPIYKLLPSAVVVAMVGYCCWPYIAGPGYSAGVQEPGATPEISATLLEPEVGPPSDRDPFQSQSAAVQESSLSARQGTAHRGSPVAEGSAGPLKGLVLSATYIKGDHRLALINGQVVAEGEPLEESQGEPSRFVVARVFGEKVQLLHQGRILELEYAMPSSQAEHSWATPEDRTAPAPLRPAIPESFPRIINEIWKNWPSATRQGAGKADPSEIELQDRDE